MLTRPVSCAGKIIADGQGCRLELAGVGSAYPAGDTEQGRGMGSLWCLFPRSPEHSAVCRHCRPDGRALPPHSLANWRPCSSHGHVTSVCIREIPSVRAIVPACPLSICSPSWRSNGIAEKPIYPALVPAWSFINDVGCRCIAAIVGESCTEPQSDIVMHLLPVFLFPMFSPGSLYMRGDDERFQVATSRARCLMLLADMEF